MKLLTIFLVVAIGCCVGKSLEGPRRALVNIQGENANGKIMMEQASPSSPVKIRGVLYGLEPGLHSLHVHAGKSLGQQCESVGPQFTPIEKRENERPAGILGNVKTFSGSPSRTDVSLISSLVSLYEDSSRNVLNRALVIHLLPDDLTRVSQRSTHEDDSRVLACGLIRPNQIEGARSHESMLVGLERPYKVDKIEQSILDGEKTWENVRHPYFGAQEQQKAPSNMNLEGVERQDKEIDSLTLESAVPTRKVWMTGYSYEYDYYGYVATGILGISTKMSGGSIKGRLVIEPVDENTLNVALLSTKAKQFNEDVQEKLIEADPGQEVRIVDQQQLEKPMQIKIIAGKVESVAIGKDEPLWIVNFKRALAAQIQLQLDQSSGVFQPQEFENYYADNAVYHALEGCSSGECQTWYHISRIPAEQIEAEQEKLLPVPELCENYPVYEIVKNRDFDKCRILPIFNYMSSPGMQCDIVSGSGCENAMSHTSTTRVIGCTTSQGHFIVQRIKSVDQLATKPLGYETEAVQGQTIQHFHLRSARQTGSSKLVQRISSDVRVYQTLAYAYDTDYQTHGPLMGKPTLRTVNSPMVMEVEPEQLKKEAQRLFAEIVSELESDSFYADPAYKYVPDKINALRVALAYFDYPELMAFVGKSYDNDAESSKNQILVDALVLAGTNPAFLILRDLIVKGHLKGEQAAQALAALPGSLETPTKDLLNSFFELLKSDAVQSQQQVEFTAALSLSRLVYQACVNSSQSLNMYPKLVMGEFCNPSDPIIANQLVPYFAEQVRSASDASERIAYLIALGNIGHEMIVPYVKPFITSCEPSSHHENEWYERNQRDLEKLSKKEMRKKWIQSRKQQQQQQQQDDEEDTIWSSKLQADADEDYEDQALCNIIRTKAIFALSNLAQDQNEIVSTLLMPIYFNKAEETEVRLAALTLLFISSPPQAFWNRVALSTWYEPNDQVAHFIYTTIASKVANKDPTNRDEAVQAEAALPLLKPMFWTSYVAQNYAKAGYVEKTRLGYLAQLTSFPGFESFIPSHQYASLSFTLGPWASQFLELAAESKHAEKFIDRLLGKPGLRSKDNKDEASITSPLLQKIKDQLQIEARATGQPQLFVYYNLLDNYQRFYTFTPENIMKTVQKQVIQKLRQGGNALSYNYQKYLPLIDSFYRVPSAMGFAYSIIGHSSLFVSVQSDAQVSYEQSVTRGSLSGQLQGQIQPVAQLHFTHKILGETPFARSYPVAGVHFDVSAAFPGQFSVEGDLKNGKFQASWQFQGDKLRLAHRSVTPYTSINKVGDFTPSILSKETQIASPADQPQQEKQYFGQQAFGLNFAWAQQGDQQAFNAPRPYNQDLLGALAFFSLPSTVRHHERSLVLDINQSETKTIKSFFSFSAKSSDEDYSRTPLTRHLHSRNLFDTIFGQRIKSQQQQREEQRQQQKQQQQKQQQKQQQQQQKWYTQQQEDDEWESQKYDHIFQTLTKPTGYSADFSVEFSGQSPSVKTRRYGSSIAYGMDDDSYRGSLMMERRSEQESESDEQNFVFCAEIDAQLPDNLVFKRKEMVKEDYERSSVFKFGFGKSCTDDRKVTVTTQWTRSEEQITPSLRAKWQETQCRQQEQKGRDVSDECVAARRLASFLNKCVVTIDYNEMPAAVQNVTYKAANLFRYWYGPYMSDNQVNVQNPQNQITIESVYYPLIGSMDVKVYKPKSNTFFQGIDVHPAAEVVLPKRMAVPRSVLAAPGVCLIGSETVTTFDGLLYNATFSGCDQLLTKDCSGRYKMAVLAREEKDKKIVTVLLDNEKIEVFPAQQRAKINGMEVSISSESYVVKSPQQQVLAVIQKTADNFIEVDASASHMVRVLSDGKEVVVLGSPIHRGRLCGLCGSQTGNKVTDLTGPRQCTIPRDLMDAAYELKNSPAGCKSDISPRDNAELRQVQEECLKERSETVFGISDVSPLLPKFQQNIYSSQSLRRFPSQWTVFRNKVIVKEGSKRCFSTESVPKCVEGSQPVETEEKKLGFHCVAQKQLSDLLNEEVQRRPLDELKGKEVDTIRIYNVPTACLPY